MNLSNLRATARFVFISTLLSFAFGCDKPVYQSDFPGNVERTWVGPDMWANRLQDWELSNGKLRCLEDAPEFPLRTIHLLSHALSTEHAPFSMSVEVDALEDPVSPEASAGFLIGSGAGLDHRSAALIHSAPGPGAGLYAGLRADGTLFISDLERSLEPIASTEGVNDEAAPIILELKAEPNGPTFDLTLEASGSGGRALVQISSIPRDRLEGNVGLVSHLQKQWFDNWTISGDKFAPCESCSAGPVLSTQYTLSENTLNMTAQLMPVGESESQEVYLETNSGEAWRQIATAAVITPGWTATFKVRDWDATIDTPYRVRYDLTTSAGTVPHYWEGTVRKDPIDQDVVSIAGFTGNHNVAHGFGNQGYDYTTSLWFPHQDIVDAVEVQDVDILFFSGDQVYEGASPTPPDMSGTHASYLDYLYKWYLWAWAYRDITKDRPSIVIPDDHDVFQGNVWGAGGRPTDVDNQGGYVMPAEWVKMVERTQTSHLPDPYDPTPIEQGIGVYYTGVTYGRIGFAVLEDRKFKSGCAGALPPDAPRPDHGVDPTFNPLGADLPGKKLLGDRQLTFIDDWAADWEGQDMKLAVSQTIFAGLATHHGANLQRIYMDLDSNGWPQSGRNSALRALRRGFIFMLGGDQHLSTLAHHGIDAFEDAGLSFCVPSVANFYPRAWMPETPGLNRPEGAPGYLGRHLDGLTNKVTVMAVTNPTSITGVSTGHEPEILHDRMPGFGIVRMNKVDRTYTVENYPRYAKPRGPGQGEQYEGWPRTFDLEENYGREAIAYLPVIDADGDGRPVVQVIDGTGEIVYTVRTGDAPFRPKVFAPGMYSVRVGNPDSGGFETIEGLEAQSLSHPPDTLSVTY